MRRWARAPALACLLLSGLTPERSVADPVSPPAVRPADLSHVVEGSGPTLVIVHGGWGDQRSFSRAAPILAQGSTVVRVSLRLHSPNPWPASEREAIASCRAMYDDDRPGTFDSFPEWRRQTLIDNARTTAPLLASSLLSEPFGCAEAQRMKMPVLLVEGEKTSPGMRAIDTKLLECMPAARRAVLPGVGHAIQFGAPEVMAVVVADFLGR